ncbi:unnamed protein product [Pylaiella littoralis]
MESASLLAGNVQRLQFLKKKTGIDLSVTVFTLYAMAIRSIIATVGEPLRAARAHRVDLFQAAASEEAALGAAAGSAAASIVDGGGGGAAAVGAAAEALAREALEAMPLPYLPSVGALLLLVAAVAAHTLLVLGKKWSVRFHAWSSFEEVLTWEEADAVLVTPVRHTGTPVICPLVTSPLFTGDPESEKGQDRIEQDSADANASTAGAHLEADQLEGLLLSELSEQHSSGEEEEEEGKATEEGEGEGAPRSEKGAGTPVFSASDAHAPAAGAGAADPPSFVYQRRKFTLVPAASAAEKPGGGNLGEEKGEEMGEEDGGGHEGVEGCVGTFGLVKLPIGWPLRRYLEASGLTSEDVSRGLRAYGENSVDVKQPTVWHHLADRLTSPFVVFSLFDQLLWMLELYWTKALFVILQVVGCEAAFVADAEIRRRQLDMRNSNKTVKRVRAWRGGEWVPIPVSNMLPGDLVSLKSGVATAREKNGDGDAKGEDDFEKEASFSVGELPADVLLLRGTAVVDEASLTGESVPQIKTSLVSEPIDFEDVLDMTGRHSSHVMLSGTTLLDQTDGVSGDSQPSSTDTDSAASGSSSSSLPAFTPDGGALCYVLRTGAYSFQGDLRRTIDFGSHGLREESKDAAYLLGFLVSFAALSSGYVVREGLKSGKISSFRLLIQCLRILSSVVPTGLSFELNQCLRNGVRSLQKGHALACTEPFRIPLAGKVDVCLFDKTGTITSDKLRAETLVTPEPDRPNGAPVTVSLGRSVRRGEKRAGSTKPGLSAEVVVGGCHSLMDVDGVLHGDPLEASALEGIRWDWNATSHTAHPRTTSVHRSSKRSKDKGTGEEGGGVSVAVWRRYAFSSQLQRMSVIAEVSGGAALTGEGAAVPQVWVLCKGSPEAMKPLLDEGGLPDWYEEEYERLARSGRRVVALAHRSLGSSQANEAKTTTTSLTRAEVEKEGSLAFDGFLSFHCKTRADSKRVIADLQRDGDCTVTIVTGDSVLTACHVAAEVGLIDGFTPPAAAEDEPEPTNATSTASKPAKGRKSTKPAKPADDADAKARSGRRKKRSGRGKKTRLEGKTTATAEERTAEPASKVSSSKEASRIAPETGKHTGATATAGRRGRAKGALLLTVAPTEHGDELRWTRLHPSLRANGTADREMEDEDARGGLEFTWGGMEALARTYDLCATGPAFELALADEDPAIGSAVQHFRVLARMTPSLKEELATSLMEAGRTVLMCGDGSNDVGALRRSHVGLALLSGFGDANTGDATADDAPPTPKGATPGGEKGDGMGHGGHPGGGSRCRPCASQTRPDALRKEREQVQADINLEFERLRSEGVGHGKAMWQASVAANEKRSDRDKARTDASQGTFAASAMAMFKGFEEDAGADERVVRTGDASLAAPFTSKKPSISAVVDAVRQGRCTLATVLQTYQIVAMEALLRSYTSSVYYIMGVRWPTRVNIVFSLMVTPMTLALASPAMPEKMSPIRPPSSVFHPSTFVSLLGQAGVHVASMAFAVRAAKGYSPEKAQPVPEVNSMFGPVFVPNLVSNAAFFLATIQAVSLAVVNFKGRPFMSGILETPAIFLPAVSIIASCFALVLEIVPAVNKSPSCVHFLVSIVSMPFTLQTKMPLPLTRTLTLRGRCRSFTLLPGLVLSRGESNAGCLTARMLVRLRFRNRENITTQLLELGVYPSMRAKLPILASMLVSLAAPLLIDRACVRMFDPELHKARKAGPPTGPVEKRNLVLLGVLLVVVAVVVGNADFDNLEETFAALE